MSYKPRTISIGVKGSEPTDGEIKGRPITACDTSEVAVTEPQLLATDGAETPSVREHRIAQIRWNPELLLMMGRGRFEVVDNALPDDVELVSASTDVRWAYQEIVLTVKSESFAVVPEGAEIPILPPTAIRRLSEGE